MASEDTKQFKMPGKGQHFEMGPGFSLKKKKKIPASLKDCVVLVFFR